MQKIEISGKVIPYHFGMYMAEAMPAAYADSEAQSSIDFFANLLFLGHLNHIKAFGGTKQIERHEVFNWVEDCYESDESAKVLVELVSEWQESKPGKKIADATKAATAEADVLPKKKVVGKK